MNEIEVKWSEIHSVVSDSLWSHGLYSPWNSPGKNTGVGSLSFLQGSSQSRDQIQVSASQADSLPAEPQGKPKNIGVGSLSLPQWIFSPQELNWGLLHCRQVLYQLSYQGSPLDKTVLVKHVLKKFLYWLSTSGFLYLSVCWRLKLVVTWFWGVLVFNFQVPSKALWSWIFPITQPAFPGELEKQ